MMAHPAAIPRSFHHDFTILRLDRPTTVAAVFHPATATGRVFNTSGNIAKPMLQDDPPDPPLMLTPGIVELFEPSITVPDTDPPVWLGFGVTVIRFDPPTLPDDAQAMTLPCGSVIVTIVLLNVLLM